MSDGGGMSDRDDGATLAALRQQLTNLEKRVDSGFTHIDSRIDNLRYVQAGEFVEWRKGVERELDRLARSIEKELEEQDRRREKTAQEQDEKIKQATRRSGWAVALFASTLLTAVFGVLQIALQAGS